MGMVFFEALEIEKGLGYFVKCMKIVPKLPKGDIIKFVTFKIQKCTEENMISYFKKAAVTVEAVTPFDVVEMSVYNKVESLSKVCRAIKEEFATEFKREKQHQGFQDIINTQRSHRSGIRNRLQELNLPDAILKAAEPVSEIQSDKIQNSIAMLIRLYQDVSIVLKKLQEKESLLDDFQKQKLDRLEKALVIGKMKNVELEGDCKNFIVEKSKELLECLDLLEKLQELFREDDKVIQAIASKSTITEEQNIQMIKSRRQQEHILTLIIKTYNIIRNLGICRPKNQLFNELVERLAKGRQYFGDFEEDLKKTKRQFGL